MSNVPRQMKQRPTEQPQTPVETKPAAVVKSPESPPPEQVAPPPAPPPAKPKSPLPPDSMMTFTASGQLLYRLVWRGPRSDNDVIALCHAVRDKSLTTAEAIYEQAQKLFVNIAQDGSLRLYSLTGRLGEPEPEKADAPRKSFTDDVSGLWRTQPGQTLHMDISQEIAAEKRRIAARGVGRKW